MRPNREKLLTNQAVILLTLAATRPSMDPTAAFRSLRDVNQCSFSSSKRSEPHDAVKQQQQQQQSVHHGVQQGAPASLCPSGNPSVSKSRRLFVCLAFYWSLGARRAALSLSGPLWRGRGLKGFTTGGRAGRRLRGARGPTAKQQPAPTSYSCTAALSSLVDDSVRSGRRPSPTLDAAQVRNNHFSRISPLFAASC